MTPTAAAGAPQRSFAHNALWLLAAEAFGKVAAFLFVVLVARGLGAEDYGAFAFAVAFVAPFYALGVWGLDSNMVREVAREPERLGELFAAGLLLRVVFGVAALVGALLVSPLFLDSSQSVLVLAIVGLALLFDQLSSFLRAVFRAFDRMELHAFVVLSNRVLSVILAFVAFRLGAGLVAVSSMYMLGSLGALGFGFLALRRRLPPIASGAPRRDVLRRLIRTGTPIGIASFLNMLTFRADVVILQSVKGTVAVATYGVAYRFFEPLLFVAYNLGDTAMPRMARRGRTAESGRTFVMTVAAVLTFYLPLAVLFLFAGEWVVVRLFSDRYEAATGALAWLGFAGALYGVTYIARMASIALGRRRDVTTVAVVALASNLAMNAYAIPRYGPTGAGATTFLTEAIEATLLVTLFLRTGVVVRGAGVLLVPLLGAAGMAGAILVGGMRGAGAILVGACAYPVVTFAAARALAPEELARTLRMLQRVVRRRSLPAEAD